MKIFELNNFVRANFIYKIRPNSNSNLVDPPDIQIVKMENSRLFRPSDQTNWRIRTSYKPSDQINLNFLFFSYTKLYSLLSHRKSQQCRMLWGPHQHHVRLWNAAMCRMGPRDFLWIPICSWLCRSKSETCDLFAHVWS